MGVPGNANALLLTSAAAAGGYQVSRSLRFNSADSAYLSRTPASAGNRKTWTWSGWYKRANLTSDRYFLFGCGPSGNDFFAVEFGTGGDADKLLIQDYPQQKFVITTQIFRDPSAWYHIVIAVDTTQATNTDRIKVYVNGSRITTFSTYDTWTQNMDTRMNRAEATAVGDLCPGFGKTFSGYMADIWFLDGIAATPSDFAETDATTGQWIPKAYTGSKGTNGFHLEFADNSNNTASTLGKDSAGSNNWTPNNFSVTAGAGNDSLVDTPTSYGTDTGVGGEVRGNYCTLNPLANGGTLSNGNLDATSGTDKVIYSTFALDSGKYYWEITLNASNLQQIGIADVTKTNTTNSAPGDSGRNGYIYLTNGSTYNNGTLLGSGLGSSTTGDVIGVAYDGSSNKLWLRKNNGSWFGGGDPAAGTSPTMTTSTSYTYTPVLGAGGGTDAVNASCNWGQRSWAYSAPSGYKALCDTNLTSPVIAKPSTVMDVVLYTGNGNSTRTISGLGFAPDLVWLKDRNNSGDDYSHRLHNSVVGAGFSLSSNSTDSERDSSAQFGGGLETFTSSGFTLEAGTNNNGNANKLNTPYVAWAFDGGTSTVSNTQGSITSQVRANASAGFSIVSFTPASSGAFTVGHGLNATPSLVIAKSRNRSVYWFVYHSALTSPLGKFLGLNATDAVDSNYASFWGTTAFSSTVFGMNTGVSCLSSDNMIAYCFAPVTGYSSFGSYTGNGSTDGPFVFTGHRSRWIMIKGNYSGGDWLIVDTARPGIGTYNVATGSMAANLSNDEGYFGANNLDILSNGFKIRSSNAVYNTNTTQYLYMAFAENPFQYARAR